MLYFETWEPILHLPENDIVRLLRSTLEYAKNGAEPMEINKNPYLTALWSQIRSTINRDAGRYKERCTKNKYNVYCREEKRHDRAPLVYEDWLALQPADNSPYQSITNDIDTIQSERELQTQLQTESELKTQLQSERHERTDDLDRLAKRFGVTAERPKGGPSADGNTKGKLKAWATPPGESNE